MRKSVREIWEVLLKMQTSRMKMDEYYTEQIIALNRELANLYSIMSNYQELIETRREQELKEKKIG